MSDTEPKSQEFQANMDMLRKKLQEERALLLNPAIPLTYFNNLPIYLPWGKGRSEDYLGMAGGRRVKGFLKDHTLEEFYADIDDAIKTENIDLSKLKNLQEAKAEAARNRNQSAWNEAYLGIIELTLPVFANLLVRGYKDTDITA